MKEGWEYFMKEFDPSDSATVELWLTSRFVRLGVGDGDTQSVDQTRDNAGELGMRGLEFDEAILQRIFRLRRRLGTLAAPERGGNLGRGVRQLLARGVVHRVDVLQLRLELSKRRAKLLGTIGHGGR